MAYILLNRFIFCKIKTAATRKYGLCPTIEACQCLMDIEQLG